MAPKAPNRSETAPQAPLHRLGRRRRPNLQFKAQKKAFFGSKMTILAIFGHFWPKMTIFGHFLTIFGAQGAKSSRYGAAGAVNCFWAPQAPKSTKKRQKKQLFWSKSAVQAPQARTLRADVDQNRCVCFALFLQCGRLWRPKLFHCACGAMTEHFGAFGAKNV